MCSDKNHLSFLTLTLTLTRTHILSTSWISRIQSTCLSISAPDPLREVIFVLTAVTINKAVCEVTEHTHCFGLEYLFGGDDSDGDSDSDSDNT